MSCLDCLAQAHTCMVQTAALPLQSHQLHDCTVEFKTRKADSQQPVASYRRGGALEALIKLPKLLDW